MQEELDAHQPKDALLVVAFLVDVLLRDRRRHRLEVPLVHRLDDRVDGLAHLLLGCLPRAAAARQEEQGGE
jgi:hypothetical protein